MMVNGEVHGVLGIAKPTAYDFSTEQIELLLAVGTLLTKS